MSPSVPMDDALTHVRGEKQTDGTITLWYGDLRADGDNDAEALGRLAARLGRYVEKLCVIGGIQPPHAPAARASVLH